MADVWTDLLFFESRDLADRLYRRIHGRRLSAAKASEVIANFAQARGYFQAASTAEALVRPLLLYYGALALARSLILFLDPTMRETSMRPGHGIGAISWGETLAQGTESAAARLRRLPDLAVEFSAGTFTEFLTATGNAERSFVYTGPYPSQIWLTRPCEVNLEPPFRVKLKEVLARIPELSDTFERAFEERSASWFSTVFAIRLAPINMGEGVQTDFNVYETRYQGLPDANVIRALLGLSDDIVITEREQSNWVNRKNQSFRITYPTEAAFIADLPTIYLDGEAGTWLIPPVGTNRFSKMALLFVASYVLGMLARYFPSYWLSLLNRAQGDLVRPVIQRTISVIQDQFPKSVLSELESRVA